jgi:hypothetical protein
MQRGEPRRMSVRERPTFRASVDDTLQGMDDSSQSERKERGLKRRSQRSYIADDQATASADQVARGELLDEACTFAVGADEADVLAGRSSGRGMVSLHVQQQGASRWEYWPGLGGRLLPWVPAVFGMEMRWLPLRGCWVLDVGWCGKLEVVRCGNSLLMKNIHSRRTEPLHTLEFGDSPRGARGSHRGSHRSIPRAARTPGAPCGSCPCINMSMLLHSYLKMSTEWIGYDKLVSRRRWLIQTHTYHHALFPPWTKTNRRKMHWFHSALFNTRTPVYFPFFYFPSGPACCFNITSHFPHDWIQFQWEQLSPLTRSRLPSTRWPSLCMSYIQSWFWTGGERDMYLQTLDWRKPFGILYTQG